MSPEPTIGIRALRASLSEVLRRAEAGQAAVVTRGTRPVARITSLREVAPSLAGLIDSGGVIPPRRTGRWRAPDPVPVWAGVRIDQALRELRG